MATRFLWDAAWTSRGNLLTTELNGVQNSQSSTPVAVFDNTANLEQFFAVRFVSGGSWTPGAGAYLEIYAIPSLDGTNYGWGTVGASPVLPSEHLVTTISLPNAAGAHEQNSRLFMLGPGKYNIVVVNRSGATMPASGNVLSIYSAADEAQ